MADKLFKSLTIDGETCTLPDSLGVLISATNKVANLPANTLLIGNDLPITSPGLYLLGAVCTFTPATTTGVTKRNYGIVRNGTYLVFQSDIDANNSIASKRMFAFLYVSGSDLPLTVQAGMSSDKAANNCELIVNAAKIF